MKPLQEQKFILIVADETDGWQSFVSGMKSRLIGQYQLKLEANSKLTVTMLDVRLAKNIHVDKNQLAPLLLATFMKVTSQHTVLTPASAHAKHCHAWPYAEVQRIC